jgi:UDP-N-acetylglucosamine acyltransferase
MAIHPTAIVDRRAEIAEDVEIGPHCMVEGNVKIGRGCRLYHNVYVTGWTEIGEACVLHPGVIIGHEPQDTKYSGARSFCKVGRGTIVREYSTMHRGTVPESATIVGEGCFLLANAHVGHNCTVGNNVTLINNVLLGGHASVGDGATLGGAVGVHQFVRIGEMAMVAAMAKVIQDVVPYALTDVRGKISGINRVGLRRAGVPHDELKRLRDAYRSLFEKGLSREAAIRELSAMTGSPRVNELLAFVKEESRRGLAGRPARATTRPHDD